MADRDPLPDGRVAQWLARWLSLVALSGCAAPRCQVPVDVALTRHPAGLPRPAAAVLVSCSDPVWARQYVCAAVDVSPTGLWCDGVQRVEVVP